MESTNIWWNKMEINVKEDRRWVKDWCIFRKIWKSVGQHRDWRDTGREGGWQWHTQGNRPGKSREHFKSLLWVTPLIHPVYFISLCVILTHSWAQGKFILLPLLSSLRNSTRTVFQVTSGWAFPFFKGNTSVSCKVTFLTHNWPPRASSRPRPCPTAVLLPHAGQRTASHRAVNIGGKMLWPQQSWTQTG